MNWRESLMALTLVFAKNSDFLILNLKYQRFTPSACGISKFEFAAKTQFLYVDNLFIKSYDPQIMFKKTLKLIFFCDKLQLIFNMK